MHIFNYFDLSTHYLALIECEDRNGTKFVGPVKKIQSIIELSYYSNSLAAHFALDAVVMCSLLKMAPKSENESNSNSVSDIVFSFSLLFPSFSSILPFKSIIAHKD